MERFDLLRTIQCRLARAAIVPSAVRGAGNAGVLSVAHAFFMTMDLGGFVARPFHDHLEHTTLTLKQAFPKAARQWGLARKLVNMFLRDAVYSRHLCERYRLPRIESLLEVPLDSYTMKGIRGHDRTLPSGVWIRSLTPELSTRFQAAASSMAAERGIARVHLDALLWGAREENIMKL